MKLYANQNKVDSECLTEAKEILKANKDEYGNYQPFTQFQQAKLLTINSSAGEQEEAEKLFLKAYDTTRDEHIFFGITKFFRSNAKKYISNNRNKAIEILDQGIKFVQHSLRGVIGNRLPFELELAILQNEFIQTYFSNDTNDTPRTTLPEIQSKEQWCDRFFTSAMKKISLPVLDEEHYTNYIPDETSIHLLTKLCSTAYHYYTNKAKRNILNRATGNDQEILRLYGQAKTMLLHGLQYDPENATLVTDFVDISIKMGDFDLSLIENINFENFSNRQQARLCKLLISNGYREYGTNLIQSFGSLDSTDIHVKNNLAYCYIEAGMWNSAARVLSNEQTLNDASLKLIRRVILEMPVIQKRRATIKLYLSKLYLKNIHRYDRQVIQARIITYFISCNTHMAIVAYRHFIESNRQKLFAKKFERSFDAYVREFLLIKFITLTIIFILQKHWRSDRSIKKALIGSNTIWVRL